MISRPAISIIAAVAENGVIGHNNALPWHLPDDLKRFKQLTLGKPVIMGRKTWESIGKALPGRLNLVITRQPDYAAVGAQTAPTLEAALQHAAAMGATDVFVIGGAELYRSALPMATRLYLTHVEASPGGDTFFPDYHPSEWRVAGLERHPADERHAFPFRFEVLERRTPAPGS
jgi:dihydrofolate reductase